MLILGIISLFIVGCSNSEVYENSIEQGELALSKQEYEKAAASFEIALDEKKEDKKAKTLLAQTNKMNEALKAMKENRLDEADALFEEVEGMKDGSKTLVRQAKEQREILLNRQKEDEAYNKKFAEIEKLKANQNFTEAKEQLNKIAEETKGNEQLRAYYEKATEQLLEIAQGEVDSEKAKVEEAKKNEEAARGKVEESASGTKNAYINKLNNIEVDLRSLQYVYENESSSGADVREAAAKELEAWDNALNEIYDVLKTQLSASEMDSLRSEQREWIKFRDKKGEEAAAPFEGGTGATLERLSVLGQLTKERCYELVNVYMK